MPRSPRSKDQTDGHPNRNVNPDLISDSSSPDPLRFIPPSHASDARLVEALTCLCCDDSGWLRIVPHDSGKNIFFKWKFNKHPWPNHYVMVRYDWENLYIAIPHLWEKVKAVHAGTRKPLYDTPYNDAE